MIVGPNKGLFFVATALICSASLYAAELAVPSRNPLARIFTGEPNRLTLPPDFPDPALVSLDQLDQDDGGCALQVADRALSGATLRTASTSGQGCQPEIQKLPGAAVLPGAVSAASPDASAAAAPVSVGGAVQSH